MNSFFPYRFVKKDSNIVLVGGGAVGKEFFIQVHETNWCEVIAWVDKAFDAYELERPFDYFRNVNNYSPDYFVIAEKDISKSAELKEELVSQYGIDEEKIVWSRCYYNLGEGFFPGDRVHYFKDLPFFMELLDDYLDLDDFFANNKYYQSYAPLGLKGARVNGERVLLYDIPNLLNKNSNVLDIGCNSGFLSLTVAPLVKSIIGVDIDERFISIANKVKNYMKIENAQFKKVDVFSEGLSEKYDAIFMLSLPSNIGVYEKADMIVDSLNPGGYLFLESHYMDSNSEAYLYDKLINTYRDKGLNEVVLHRNAYFDNRDITVLRKID